MFIQTTTHAYQTAAQHLLPFLPEGCWANFGWGIRIADGKRAKINLYGASSKRPDTLQAFSSAIKRLGLVDPQGKKGFRPEDPAGYEANMIAFRVGPGIVVYDFDKCRDPASGQINREVKALLAKLDTFAHVSPSGTGIHAIGRVPAENIQPDLYVLELDDGSPLEIYVGSAMAADTPGANYFSTFTADVLPGYDKPLRDVTGLTRLMVEERNATVRAKLPMINRAASEPTDPSTVAAAMELIPNDNISWNDWSRIGAAIYNATGGSVEGLEIFRKWSARSFKHKDAECDGRWSNWQTHPYTAITFGSLVHLARLANPDFLRSSGDGVPLPPDEYEHGPFEDDAPAPDESVYSEENAEAFAPQTPSLDAPPSTDWMSYLVKSKRGDYKTHDLNAVVMLTMADRWMGRLRFNEFSLTTELDGKPVQDHHIHSMAVWAQQQQLDLSPSCLQVAVDGVARRNSYHPVREMLQGLEHDGKARIGTWLIDYAGAEDTPLNRAYSRKWLIAAVARVMDPGCKFDNVLILEGAQGIGKSTVFAVLAGNSEWFLDDLGDINHKDSLERIQGNWIVEIAELSALSRAEVKTQKAFISRQVDKFRLSYGRRAISAPRQCIFGGSVNPGAIGYLEDETGARRYWPVACGSDKPKEWKIDVAGLLNVRDQIWAEAVAAYDSGECWWLESDDLVEAQKASAHERYAHDAWEPIIAQWIEKQDPRRTDEILIGALDFVAREIKKVESNRVAKIMRVLGFELKKRGSDWRWFLPNEVGADVIPLAARRTEREKFEKMLAA